MIFDFNTVNIENIFRLIRMNIERLKVDSNFFKVNCVVDSSKVVSYVQLTKKVDKSILPVHFEAKLQK